MGLGESDGMVWRVIGPIVVTVVMLGGGAWLNHMHGEIGEVRADQKQEREERQNLGQATVELKVRVQQLGKDVDELKKSTKNVEQNTERILQQLKKRDDP